MNIPWLNSLPIAITVTDKSGKIIEMNDQSAIVFSKQGGYDLIGKDLSDCHNPHSQEVITRMMESNVTNAYTIEKEGKRKLIYQTPWYINNEVAGLVEISIVIPNEMPHFIRK
ncbi:MAG: PAS domain-containing protein [Omnitrophica WOR_2 bacterium]|jgi:transcriptional regulator with PAS, ATPase and Fis domain